MTVKLFTPSDLADITGLSTGAQRLWRRDGLFRDHGTPTDGGHWRFDSRAVIFVVATRAVASMGVSLAVAGMLVDSFILEIEGEITGKPRIHPARAHCFAWRRDDSTDEAFSCLRDSRIQIDRNVHGNLRTDALTIHQNDGWCAVNTDDLNDIPRLSKAGGVVITPAGIADKLPRQVILAVKGQM